MRRSKELIVLLALLIAAIVFVLGFVVRRRAEIRADPLTRAPRERGPLAPTKQARPYVDLKATGGKTVDFSSGRPVMKDSPEDRAALEAGLKEIEEATQNLTFEAQKKPEPKKP